MEQALNDFPLWGRLDSFLYVIWASAKMSCTCQELLLYQIALGDDYLKIFNFRKAYFSLSEYVGVKPMFKRHQLCGKYGDVGATWTFFLMSQALLTSMYVLCLWCTSSHHRMPGTELNMRDTLMSNTPPPCPIQFTVSWGKRLKNRQVELCDRQWSGNREKDKNAQRGT